MRVSPFRHPWINGYLPLPMAFRSLSRLSSAPGAKASALCPYQLNLSCGFSCRRLHSVAARAVLVLSLVLLLVASLFFLLLFFRLFLSASPASIVSISSSSFFF